MYMTTVYFIRHAESDVAVRDPMIRPLTEKGRADVPLVTKFLTDKNIEAVYSSPYKRAIDTVSEFAKKYGHEIKIKEGLKERVSDGKPLAGAEFAEYFKKYWSDKSSGNFSPENFIMVQERNIKALNEILNECENKAVAVGTHGIALSTIINFYDKTYGYDDFMAMVYINPWAVKMEFEGRECVSVLKINLFDEIFIRNMGEGDYEAVRALWQNTAGMGLNDVDDSRDGIVKYLSRNPDTCFVAEKAGKVAGAVLAGHDGRRGFIYHLAVAADCRRRGVGSSLIKKAADSLMVCGITKVALVVKSGNETGNEFWEKRGFCARGDLIYRDKALTELKRIDT